MKSFPYLAETLLGVHIDGKGLKVLAAGETLRLVIHKGNSKMYLEIIFISTFKSMGFVLNAGKKEHTRLTIIKHE